MECNALEQIWTYNNIGKIQIILEYNKTKGRIINT